MADNNIAGMYQKDPTVGYGVGGINGMHHDFLGWDNTTVGMASSIYDNLLTQNGVHTNDPNYLGALEPLRTGKFLVKWLKIPTFFNATAAKYLKFFLENCVKQVDGIAANTINTAGTVTFGANGQEMDYPGQIKQNNKNVTLTTLTCTGDGLGKLMRYWMYGITDPETSVHHMYGKDLRFERPNYSGTLLYALLGPTARPGDIEYACMWNEVWPVSSDGKDKFNSGELGADQTVGDQQVELTGIFQDGPECNILAKYIVAGSGLAGQSYFDQVLPAYMYDKYVNELSNKTEENDTIKNISVTQDDKLANALSQSYTDDIKTIRKDMTDKYGLTNAAPSNTITPVSEINEVDSFTNINFTDKMADTK